MTCVVCFVQLKLRKNNEVRCNEIISGGVHFMLTRPHPRYWRILGVASFEQCQSKHWKYTTPLSLCTIFPVTQSVHFEFHYLPFVWLNKLQIRNLAKLVKDRCWDLWYMLLMPVKAHFHSRKISTDRKFSEYIIVKSWEFSTSKFFSDGKFVSANHSLQNFLSVENFPEWNTLRTIDNELNMLRTIDIMLECLIIYCF